jgi:hypothetical protein
MSRNDQNIEIAKLQKEIISRLGITQDNAIFNFKQKNDVERFDLVTINPKHEQSFLFHTVHGTDRVDALKKMLEYISEHYSTENSMTIQWIKIGEINCTRPTSALRICMRRWISSTTSVT